jgi:thioredoxin 1
MALTITSDNFSELLSKENELVMVDFWAEWCGPCKMLSPIVDELSQELDGKMTIGKVDVSDQQDLAAEYGVRNIPTILFFKNGELVDKQVGALPKAALQEIINKHLNKKMVLF